MNDIRVRAYWEQNKCLNVHLFKSVKNIKNYAVNIMCFVSLINNLLASVVHVYMS